MNKAYHETLPKNYFGNLYEKVTSPLIKGENVCISVIPGLGVKTLFNFLHYNIAKSKIFDKTYVYDPEIEKINLVDFTKNIASKNTKKKLIFVRFFEQIEFKNQVLEKLDSLRRKDPKNLVFLVLTDHGAVINFDDYQATSTIFFSDIIYFPPFDLNRTEAMVETLTSFYGWKIEKSLIKDIFKLSGGIPRLIKYLCKETYESRVPITNLEKFILVPQMNFQIDLVSKILIREPKNKTCLFGLTDEEGRIKSQLVKYYLKNYKSDVQVTHLLDF